MYIKDLLGFSHVIYRRPISILNQLILTISPLWIYRGRDTLDMLSIEPPGPGICG
jgi:hypothetical protein